MFRPVVLLAFSAVPLAGERAVLSPLSTQSGCGNSIVHEPLIIYEVSGGTLAGPVDLHLTVYSDGAVRVADMSDPSAPRGGLERVDPEAVSSLALYLERMGAGINCDADGIVMDVPLHTLTLLKPGTNPRGHTYSWWLPEDSSGDIAARLEQFVAEVFPEF